MLIGGFCGRGDLLVVIQNATITETAVDNSEPGLVVVGRLVDMIEVVSRPVSLAARRIVLCRTRAERYQRKDCSAQNCVAAFACGKTSDGSRQTLGAAPSSCIRLSPWAARPACCPMPATSLISACPRGRRWPSTGRLKP